MSNSRRLEGLKPATCYTIWAEVTATAALTATATTTQRQTVCTVPARPPSVLSAMLADGQLRWDLHILTNINSDARHLVRCQTSRGTVLYFKYFSCEERRWRLAQVLRYPAGSRWLAWSFTGKHCQHPHFTLTNIDRPTKHSLPLYKLTNLFSEWKVL